MQLRSRAGRLQHGLRPPRRSPSLSPGSTRPGDIRRVYGETRQLERPAWASNARPTSPISRWRSRSPHCPTQIPPCPGLAALPSQDVRIERLQHASPLTNLWMGGSLSQLGRPDLESAPIEAIGRKVAEDDIEFGPRQWK